MPVVVIGIKSESCFTLAWKSILSVIAFPMVLLVPLAVKSPLEVNPEVAVMRPEMVGVAVQAVPVTVRFPPREVRLLPETVNVLSSVVAPWRVRAPGVVTEPMVFIDDAPEPKVLVVDEPVPRVVLPLEVSVVKAPVPAVPAPTLTKLAAPAAVTFQLLSVMETVVEEALPMVMVLATASLPMVMVLAVVPPSPMWMVSAFVPVPRLMVLVTLVDPRFKVVAALARLNVEAVVVIFPPLTARSPAAVRLTPSAVRAVDPLELTTTFPVVAPPIVKLAAFVVARFPSPVK